MKNRFYCFASAPFIFEVADRIRNLRPRSGFLIMDTSLLGDAANQPVQPIPPLSVPALSETQGAHRKRTLLILACVWIISSVYVAANLYRGWVPHDEGTYAQSADRVLHGELPHRDFDDHYTGGMSFLNAFAFWILGTKLSSLRVVLFVFFLGWVPAIFYIATRFASDLAAGAIVLLAIAWSIPNYSAAVPSWYNLSFALFGAVAIFKYLESRSPWWLFLSGLCGGSSILVKITGVYFVLAAVLFFVSHEQCEANKKRKAGTAGGWIYSLILTLGLLSFIAFLCFLIRSFSGGASIVQFVLPGAALAYFLLLREFQKPLGSGADRFKSLIRMLAHFAAGLAIPIILYSIPYFRSRSLPALFRGVFILPQLHMQYTVMLPPPLSAMPPTLVLAGLIALALCLKGTARFMCGAIVVVACAAALIASGRHESVYRFIWNSLSYSIPLTVLSGALLLLWRKNAGGASERLQQPFMLLLCLTATWTLVQIPFAASIYFCFVAPILALTVLAFFSMIPGIPKFVLGALLCFYLLFAVLRTVPGFIYRLGFNYYPDIQTTPFDLPRAGRLRINADDAQLYERLIPLIQEHANGEYTYAAPDCPEVYFLSGLRNPTRTLFDYFDDPVNHSQRVLSTMEQNRVNVVAILEKPPFSPPLAPDLKAALVERFPNSSTVGRFEVRWRQ